MKRNMPTDFHMRLKIVFEPFDNSYRAHILLLPLHKDILENYDDDTKQKRTQKIYDERQFYCFYIVFFWLILSSGCFLCDGAFNIYICMFFFALFFNSLYSHFMPKCLSYNMQRQRYAERWMGTKRTANTSLTASTY